MNGSTCVPAYRRNDAVTWKVVFDALFSVTLVGIVLVSLPARATIPISDGERIVLLGAGWVEGLQQEDYWETVFTTRLNCSAVTFRNQGWAGDTVQGVARALFGTPDDGFTRLMNDLRQAQPTLILLAYGNNEAHEGREHLSVFLRHWNRLLDALATLEARVVVLLPHLRTRPRPTLPDPSAYNTDVEYYREAIRQSCRDRQLVWLDVADSEAWSHTTDGIRLTPYGYWILAQDLARKLGYPEPAWELCFDVRQATYDAVNVLVHNWSYTPSELCWSSVDRYLPSPYPPPGSPWGQYPYGTLCVRHLSTGTYQLIIDDLPVIVASSEQWHQGLQLPVRAGWQRVEQLRMTIREKNQLYFHRYRPQNETYLFLFRKHEQGNNAVEIPQFDPLIAEKEKMIEELKKPIVHCYKLVRLPD